LIEKASGNSRGRGRPLTNNQTRVLLFLSKRGGWAGTDAQLARDLDIDPGNLHRVLESLIQAGFLREEAGNYKLTRSGRGRIGYLRLPYFMILMIAVLSIFPLGWGVQELEFNIQVDPFLFIIVAILIIAIAVFLWFVVRFSERSFL
jgi:hypothetical protein